MTVDITESAKLKACELINAWSETPWEPRHFDERINLVAVVFARYIQQVSAAAEKACRDLPASPEWVYLRDALAPFILPDPVDPLLIEAREIVKATLSESSHARCDCRARIDAGKFDDGHRIRATIAALKRGMELAGGQP